MVPSTKGHLGHNVTKERVEKSPLITPESLPQGIRTLQITTNFDPVQIQTDDEVIKDYAEKVVKMVNGNRSKAAEMLGISWTSLWKILREE